MTAGGWPAPEQPAAGDAGLLREAFRLFADSRKQLLSRKPEEIQPAAAIEPLRRHLHDDLLSLLSALRGGDREAPSFLGHYEPALSTMGFAAQARGILGILTDPAHRRANATSWLADPAKRKLARHRRLEDLHAVTAELRGLARRTPLEAALTTSFGPDIVTPWGGTQVIERADRKSSSHAKGGYVEHEIFGIGPSEKLRQEFLTPAFKKARAEAAIVPEIAATAPGGPPFRAHLEIERRIDVLANEVLPPARRSMPSLTQWLADLRRIEIRYAAASNLKDGAAVGFPLGAVLAAVLRAYLYDLIAHVLVLAVPAERARTELDGYLGVALYEALAGTPAKHVELDGYLTADPHDPVLTRLADWTVVPFADGWPAAVEQHAASASSLRTRSEKPVMSGDTSTDWETWQAGWSRYPITRAPGIWRRAADPSLDWYQGAHLSAQCHLYVANWILRVAIDDLELPGRTQEFADPGFLDHAKPAAPLLATPSNQSPPGDPTRALQVIAGSSLWNARKPPHRTHNDGASFDLRFGPNTPGWPFADFGVALAAYLPAGPEYRNPFIINTHRWGKDAKGRDVIEFVERGAVFEPAVKQIVERELARLTARLGKAVGPAELTTYDSVDEKLAGTPHVLHAYSAQAIHAGLVAILLSGPSQVIFSSPIAHARAIRAIRTRLTHLTSTDSVSDAQKALDRALRADFAFMPHNHWHHWHVHYNEPRGRPMSADAGIERVRAFLPLWEALGVDLEPFASHLRNLDLRPPPPAEHARVAEERTELADLVEHNYAPSADGRGRLHELFRAFDAGQPLNAPAEGVECSAELQAAVTACAQVRLAAEIDNFLFTLGAYRQLIESLDPYITAPAPPP